MTRATEKPLRRLVQAGSFGTMVLELRAETIVLRPYRSRRGGPAEVLVSHGAIYLRSMMVRVEAERAAKRKARAAKARAGRKGGRR